MSWCKKCNEKKEHGALFCNECGSVLVSNIICPKCGKEYPDGSAFCMKDGTKLILRETEYTELNRNMEVMEDSSGYIIATDVIIPKNMLIKKGLGCLKRLLINNKGWLYMTISAFYFKSITSKKVKVIKLRDIYSVIPINKYYFKLINKSNKEYAFAAMEDGVYTSNKRDEWIISINKACLNLINHDPKKIVRDSLILDIALKEWFKKGFSIIYRGPYSAHLLKKRRFYTGWFCLFMLMGLGLISLGHHFIGGAISTAYLWYYFTKKKVYL